MVCFLRSTYPSSSFLIAPFGSTRHALDRKPGVTAHGANERCCFLNRSQPTWCASSKTSRTMTMLMAFPMLASLPTWCASSKTSRTMTMLMASPMLASLPTWCASSKTSRTMTMLMAFPMLASLPTWCASSKTSRTMTMLMAFPMLASCTYLVCLQ